MTSGDVVVPAFGPGAEVFDDRCRALMIRRDADVRIHLALALPPLNLDAVEWAALLFFQGCQLFVCREVPEATVTAVLSRQWPGPRDSSTHYSVDLIFQFLPDLMTLASRLDPGDPLISALTRLAREWPLSSVGIPLGDAAEEIPFLSDPSLMRIYADRVTERGARDRLNNAALCKVLQADAGLLTNLLPFPASAYSHD